MVIRSPDGWAEVHDYGWERIMAACVEASQSYTKVGLPADGKTTGRHDMPTLIEIGMANELGVEDQNLPSRPFMRQAFDKNEGQIIFLQQDGWDNVVLGQETVRGALRRIGSEVESMIKEEIMGQDFKDLSEVTKEHKTLNKDMILIETGQLLDSIQHKEYRGGVEHG